MNRQEKEQDLLNRIYDRDQKATLEIMPRFVKSIRYYLREQGCDRRKSRPSPVKKLRCPLLDISNVFYLYCLTVHFSNKLIFSKLHMH